MNQKDVESALDYLDELAKDPLCKLRPLDVQTIRKRLPWTEGSLAPPSPPPARVQEKDNRALYYVAILGGVVLLIELAKLWQ